MTSIESLFYELWNAPKDKFEWHSILEKAKEMHKQEIKNAFTEGEFNIHNSKRDEEFEYETSEQYYQEKFKNN